MDPVHDRRANRKLPHYREGLLRAGEVGLAMADVIVAVEDFDFDGAIGIGGAAGDGVVGAAGLGAQLAVYAVEEAVEIARRGGIEHCAAGGVGHGFEGVFASGVAAAFGFDGSDNDGVKESAGADSGFARGIEIAVAGGFAGIGDHDDDAAAVIAALLQRGGSEQNGVVDRSARAGRDFAHGLLEGGNIVGECRDLRYVFVEGVNREAVAGAENLPDEVRGGLLLERNFLVGAEAGVDHEREIERLLGFGLKNFYFFLPSFFKDLKSLDGQVRGGAIVLVKNAAEHADQIHVDANLAALLGRIGDWIRTVVAGVNGSRRGRVRRRGSGARRLRLSPGRTVRLALRRGATAEE